MATVRLLTGFRSYSDQQLATIAAAAVEGLTGYKAYRPSRRRCFDTSLQNSFEESPRPAAMLARDFLRSLCSRGERARTKLSNIEKSQTEPCCHHSQRQGRCSSGLSR